VARVSAPASRIRALVKEMEAPHLQCRDYGHGWRPVTAYREGRTYVRVLSCANCGTEKKQRLSSYGEVLSNRMSYPEGYLFKGVGRITGEAKNVVRLASLAAEIDA